MKKFIGIKMIEAEPMTAGEAIAKSYLRIKPEEVRPSDEFEGYHVHYPDGYDSWSPKDIFEKAYFGLEKSDSITDTDIKNFTKNVYSTKVGTKTTNTTIECITGYEAHGQSSCVKPENFDLTIGEKYARPHAEDSIWAGLGFVLQWTKYGLNK